MFTNASASSMVVSTGMPSSSALRRIWYSSSSIPMYFSRVAVPGMFMIKSIFLWYSMSAMLGCRSGSDILWTTFTAPNLSSKNSAVCSVASMLKPISPSFATVASSFSLLGVPPTVIRADPPEGRLYPTAPRALERAS